MTLCCFVNTWQQSVGSTGSGRKCLPTTLGKKKKVSQLKGTLTKIRKIRDRETEKERARKNEEGRERNISSATGIV